ncbi:MAG: FHA domain-containing protein [Acidobacteria bacterium]|nr:FHA domain-containing protein [Acidobacteriota bacterium]
MMETQASKYIITREDLNVDPIALLTDGLKIGRLPGCELVLNHPTVSRLHAGINAADGRFYVFNFSHSSGTTLNGRVIPVEEAEVLADGDALQIGPFILHAQRQGDALNLRVSLQVAVKIGEVEARDDIHAASTRAVEAKQDARLMSGISDSLSVFWEKRKREAGKMQRLSALRPQAPSRVLGKARFNWTPTRDLVRPWPVSVFVWGVIVVGLLSVVAAVGYTKAFSPAPLSGAHARATAQVAPAIAVRPNANSCTTCHTLKSGMESNCAACHQTEAFAATITKPHVDAGITCVNCHAEHRGVEFSPAADGVQACASCHDDANHQLYRGKPVKTPHGGTFGYPVANGKWVWAGLDQAEWARKPPGVREALGRMEDAAHRQPTAGDAADRQRSAQFHILHLHRVKTVEGLRGNKDGEMSCSSCHQSFAPIDRITPRTTCASCHNGNRAGRFQSVVAGDQPNCVSCHVQHFKDARPWASLFLDGARGQ